MHFRALVGLFLLVIITQPARGDDAVDYVRQVKPVLQARCYACHGVLKQKGGLRLDTAALAIKGGENGAAIEPRDVEGSLLLERVASNDESDRMPPEGERLKPAEIAAIRAWVSQGAKSPADEKPESDPRDHWAFKPPVRPAIPTLDKSHQNWVKNPIDAFVAHEHQNRGLIPQRTADRRIWLRRVTLDLIGLPPTLAELDAFVADQSPDAYEKVADRLLGSPAYGERWGRHWMDVWRYSDWWGLGAEVRNSQKHIWHWRDWIIESLNSDKGYDQMIREMLASDELYPNDLDRLRGSGFLARQYFKFNRTSWLDETIEHTSKAMLGLTMNCSKCHDHKYDPISQADYYRFRSFFEPYQVRTDMVPGELDVEKDGIPRPFDCNLETRTFLHIRGDDRNPDKNRVIESVLPAFLTPQPIRITQVVLPPDAIQPGLRPFVVEAALKNAKGQIKQARNEVVEARLKLAEAEKRVNVPQSTAVVSKAIVADDFSAAKPDVWQTRSGSWKYDQGKLIQSQTGASNATLRLKSPTPTDFEAKLVYKPTGGEMWKSVGIHFDVTDQNDISVYLSSHGPGPKSQVCYKRGSAFVYPPEGAENRPISLNKPHELIVRVRGTLVNLIVDGAPSVAYRLPIPRQQGQFEISTFDARAELSRFELRTLSPEVAMIEPGKPLELPLSGPRAIERAKLSLEIAETTLRHVEAQPELLKARVAADRARLQQPQSAEMTKLVTNAAKLERQSDVTMAEKEVASARLAVDFGPAAKKAEAEKKLKSAQEGLEKAIKAVKSPGEAYTSLSGSLKTFESNLETEESRKKPFPKTSTGRRSALAQWMTDRKHPLVARVAVNHIWNRHFGTPLVPTVFDFGRKGTPPTHPELLDWLALELIEHNWSMRHIHRLIVTSNTYRLSSSNDGASRETLKHDAENRYYWRANPVRMQSELIRDSLLSLAGELDLKRGGPSIPVENVDSKRRSLYFVHSHNQHQKFLEMFDDAGVLECYRRAESIVPQQALALENSTLANAAAEKITRKILSNQPKASEKEFVKSAFLTILSFEPSADEQLAVHDAMAQWTELAKRRKNAEPELQARINLVQALINHNDFVTVR